MNDTMGKFKCRNSECDKEFVNSSNRSKHEKKTKHYVPGPRAASRYEPRWDEDNNLFRCPKPCCEVNIPKRSNMFRHIQKCNVIAERKRKREDDKICPYCDKEFKKKFNLNPHIAVHSTEDDTHVSLSFVISDDGLTAAGEDKDVLVPAAPETDIENPMNVVYLIENSVTEDIVPHVESPSVEDNIINLDIIDAVCFALLDCRAR